MTITERVEAIAERLGYTLGDPQYEHGGYIKTDFGGEIFLRFDGGIISISGNYCRDIQNQHHYPKDRTSIKVSASKTDETIAKDIKRRFIPFFALEYFESKECADSWTSHITAKRNLAKTLCDAAGIDAREDYGSQDISGYMNRDKDNEKYIRMLMHSTTCDLTIDSLTEEQALQVIALVRKF